MSRLFYKGRGPTIKTAVRLASAEFGPRDGLMAWGKITPDELAQINRGLHRAAKNKKKKKEK